MLKIVLSVLQNILTLARDLEDNRKEIKELNEKIYALASAVNTLSQKIEANTQQEAAERRALILKLENELLKSDKRLPLPKKKRRQKPKSK